MHLPPDEQTVKQYERWLESGKQEEAVEQMRAPDVNEPGGIPTDG
jgi:hypothetical protein